MDSSVRVWRDLLAVAQHNPFDHRPVGMATNLVLRANEARPPGETVQLFFYLALTSFTRM